MEIKSVAKMKGERYKINDSVILEDVNVTEDCAVTYNLHWDGNLVSESGACELADTFMNNALTGAIKEK